VAAFEIFIVFGFANETDFAETGIAPAGDLPRGRQRADMFASGGKRAQTGD